ncbi:MAG: portal protein, partial [Pseudomonadota bacterium]|nr:portal protein [Pseudomonadota bacterium]
QRYGYDRLPEKLRQLADKGSRDRLTFFHHVGRNHAWRRGQLGPQGKRWFSIHAAEEGATVLRHAGYDDMPFFAPRWNVETGAVYARGPGWTALPAGRKLELMTAANLRAGQRAADPTLLAPSKEDWPLSGRIRPGHVLYGGVDMAGRQLVRALDVTSHTGLSLEMQQQAVEEMRDGFHWSLMNLAGRTGMTATEVIERQEEKLRLMAPHLGRIQEEYLAPKIARRFQLLWKAGQMPPPPPEAAGSPLTVEYTSAAAMAARSAEGAATVRLLADLGPLAEVKPEVVDRLSVDDIVEVLAEARGAPARLLLSRDEAGQLRQARAEREQAASMLQAAQTGGGIARDLAAAPPPGGAGWPASGAP